MMVVYMHPFNIAYAVFKAKPWYTVRFSTAATEMTTSVNLILT